MPAPYFFRALLRVVIHVTRRELGPLGSRAPAASTMACASSGQCAPSGTTCTVVAATSQWQSAPMLPSAGYALEQLARVGAHLGVTIRVEIIGRDTPPRLAASRGGGDAPVGGRRLGAAPQADHDDIERGGAAAALCRGARRVKRATLDECAARRTPAGICTARGSTRRRCRSSQSSASLRMRRRRVECRAEASGQLGGECDLPLSW